LQLIQGVSHTLSGGLITPTFAQHPPASGGKGEERGREGRGKGKGRGEGKGRDPQGLVDTPHVPNPEKYPELISNLAGRFGEDWLGGL